MSITENQYACLFNINKNQDQFSLDCKVKKKFGTYIYDVAPIPNKCINIEHQNNMDIIAVTSKNTPVMSLMFPKDNVIGSFIYNRRRE